MKTIIQRIVAAMALFAAVAAVAQTSLTISDPSAAQPIAWSQVPPVGTFWVVGPHGLDAPYPCPPRNLTDAPIYALDNGQFVVDTRNSVNFARSAAMMPSVAASQQFSPLNNPQLDPLLITSNVWFNQIVISNHTYVSLNGVTLDANGNVMSHQLPFGVMFPVTTTDLTTPMAQWQPIGQTNAIGNSGFSLPYNPMGDSHAFYRFCAQLDTNNNPEEIMPFTLKASNISILTDQGVTLTWTNGQPDLAAENDAIVEMDTNGHSYLVSSVITTNATDSLSFELQNTTNLTFVRYSIPANTSGLASIWWTSVG